MPGVWDLAPQTNEQAGGGVWDLAPVLGGTVPTGRRAQDFGDSVIAGLQASSGGLAVRRKLPDMEMPSDAPWYNRLGAAVGGMAGDVPAMVAGGLAVEAATGGKAGPVAAAAGAFAAPMALREALIEAYTHNYALDWNGVSKVGFAAAKGALKGGVIGAATMGAGKVVAPFVENLGGKALVAGTAAYGAEVGALTTTAAAMEGHLPSWQDFMDNAILLGGLKGATSVARGMYHTFAETGKTPEEMRADAERDPALKAELLGKTASTIKLEATDSQLRDLRAERTSLEGKARNAEEGLRLATVDEQIKALTADRLKTVDAAAAENMGPAPELPSAYSALALDERIKAAINAEPLADNIRQTLGTDSLKPVTNEPNAKPAVNWEYVTDNATLKGVIRNVTEATQAQIEQQTRGVVTNKATAAEALRGIASGEVYEHQVGTAGTATDMYTAAFMLKDAAAKVVEEHRKVQGIAEADLSPALKVGLLAAVERMTMVNAEFAGVRAEAGRSMQLLGRIKRDPAYLGEAEFLLKAAARKGTFQDLVAALGRASDPTALAEFAKKYNEATGFQKFVEAFRAFIFSGPQTWEANILGNIAKLGVDFIERPIAATVEAALRPSNDPMKMAQFKARALAPFYGLQLAAVDGMHIVKEWGDVVKRSGFVEGAKTAKADLDQFLTGHEKIETMQRANASNTSTFGKAVNAFVGWSFGSLKIQDLPFRNVGERMAMHTLAVDRAIEDGFHPDSKEFGAAVVRYRDDPTFGLNEAQANKVLAKIEKSGDMNVFTEPMGPRTAAASAAVSGTVWEFLLPARKTPVNLFDWAVQHIPLMNLLSGRWREDYTAGGERKAQAIARVVVGTGIAATAYTMAQNGLLTGGGLTNPQMSGTNQGAGQQPYSFSINGKYYSVQRIEPIAKILMLAGDLVDISEKSSKDDRTKAITLLTLAFANATISTTYLSGLASFFKGVLIPDRYGDALAESYGTTLVPKIIGQPTLMADPYKRQVDGILDAIQSQLPVLRSKLLAKRDVWGEQVKNERWLGVLPIATTEASEEKVRTEAMRLAIAIADAPKYIESRGPLPADQRRIDITPEQRDIMKEVSGKAAMAWLSPVVNSPNWDKIPDYVQGDIYRKVLDKARRQGAYAALPADDAARLLVMEKNINEMMRQIQDAEGGTKPTSRRVK
jgi:hypothetical protein